MGVSVSIYLVGTSSIMMPPARHRHVLSILTRQFRTPDFRLTRAISPVTAPGKDRLGRTIGPTEEASVNQRQARAWPHSQMVLGPRGLRLS
jgi:hypothetical protein